MQHPNLLPTDALCFLGKTIHVLRLSLPRTNISMRLSNPDVEVVFGSVESGCRVMLTYDLSMKEEVHLPSPTSAQSTHELLYKTLLDLKRLPEASGKIPGVFAHVLESTHELRFPIYDVLESHERDLLRVLQCVCSEIGILVYLADIQRKITGSGLNAEQNFEMDAITSDSVRLNQVFDFDGTQMAQYIEVEEQNLVRDFPEAFGDLVSYEMNEEGGGVSYVYNRVVSNFKFNEVLELTLFRLCCLWFRVAIHRLS